MLDTEQGLIGTLEYNTDLFNAAPSPGCWDISKPCWRALLLIHNSVYRTYLLTPVEQQLLVEWNDTQTDYPIDQCVHQLFEAQVERTLRCSGL